MKTKSLRNLSILLALVFVLSAIPSVPTFAASKKKYSAKIKYVIVSSEYIVGAFGDENCDIARYNNNVYLLDNTQTYTFPVCTFVSVETKAKKYNIKYRYKGYGIDQTYYNNEIFPKLPIGRYTLEVTVYGDEIAKPVSQTINICMISKTSFNYCRRLYKGLFDKNDDNVGKDCYEFAYDISSGQKGAYNVAMNVFDKYRNELTKSTLGDEGFLQKIYKGLLDRTPDKEGLNWWEEQLRNHKKTREQVYVDFLH